MAELRDYVTHDIDVHLTSDGETAILTFHTAEGPVGVTCQTHVLEALNSRISHRLAAKVRREQPH